MPKIDLYKDLLNCFFLDVVEAVDQVGHRVLPAPVAPTSATFWPGLANQVMSCSTGLSGL